MANAKQRIRSRATNRFRFYPLFQRRESKKLSNGNYINNYINVGAYPCDRKVLSSVESSVLEARKMSSNVKLMGRYPRFDFNNGDRFLFFENMAMQDILYLSHFNDKTGRREYGEFYCDSGEFTSIATQGLKRPLLFAKNTQFISQSDSLRVDQYGDIDFLNRENLKQPLIKNIQTFTDLDFNLPSYSAPQGIIRSYDPVSHIIQFDRDIGQRVSLFISSDTNVGLYLLESLTPSQFTYRVDADQFTNEFPNDTFSPDEELIVNLEDENFNILEFQTPLYLTFFEDISSVKGTDIKTKSTFNFTKINDRQFVTEQASELIEIEVGL